MTEKQRLFCEEYLLSGNGVKALKAAGYSDIRNPARVLNTPVVRNYLAEKMELVSCEKVSSAGEILGFLSAVMRGEISDFRVVKNGGEVSFVRRPPSLKERIAAASLLGKRYGLFRERISIEDASRVIFTETDIPD